MERGELLYEGKAKRVYRTADPRYYLVEFKDDATAFDGKKRGVIERKGFYNNQISAYLFSLLARSGVPNHFVRVVGETQMLVRALRMFRLEVIVRNVAAGSLSRRLGIEEGTPLFRPVVEYYYKDDALGDPMVNESHIEALRLATPGQLQVMQEAALRANGILKTHLAGRDIDLVDFKLEFGVDNGEILMGDEISPDTCRFWDRDTGEKLDKDRFRRDLGGVAEAYAEVYRRLVGNTRGFGQNQ